MPAKSSLWELVEIHLLPLGSNPIPALHPKISFPSHACILREISPDGGGSGSHLLISTTLITAFLLNCLFRASLLNITHSDSILQAFHF